MIFPGDVCLEESGIWITDAWSIISTFSLIAIFYLRKTENRSKKISNTALPFFVKRR